MFDNLTDKLGGIFDGLRKQGTLKEEDVAVAMREVRIALLEADVALPVAKEFINKVKEKAVGESILRSVSPAQQVVKIVHDELVEVLGSENSALTIDGNPPLPYLMVGLQGGGKTTTSAKLALFLKDKERKKVLMASLDTQRPAAQEQLEILGTQIGVGTLPIIKGQSPIEITERAMDSARKEGYDIVILDTAGRLSINNELMDEVKAIRDIAKPVETLLVADAMTGQDAVITATNFNEQIGLSGIILSRMDGDARGGATFSMKAVTGKPIKMIGIGETVDAIQPFYPDRIADRILGMGDVVSLVEKASETIEQEDAEKLALKMRQGKFDLDDFEGQLKQMKKMGGFAGIMQLMPGMRKMKSALDEANIDDTVFKQQEAILSSMNKKEKSNPKILNASRRKRIAKGSGTSVQDVNRLLKQFQQMQTMMKKLKKMGGKGLMKSLGGMFGGGTPDMDAMASEMGIAQKDEGPLGQNPFASGGGLSGGDLPSLGGMPPGAPMGLPPLGTGSPSKKMNKRKKAQAEKRAKRND